MHLICRVRNSLEQRRQQLCDMPVRFDRVLFVKHVDPMQRSHSCRNIILGIQTGIVKVTAYCNRQSHSYSAHCMHECQSKTQYVDEHVDFWTHNYVNKYIQHRQSKSLTESSSLVRVWMIGNRSNGSVVAFTRLINPMFAVFAAEQISYTKVEKRSCWKKVLY